MKLTNNKNWTTATSRIIYYYIIEKKPRAVKCVPSVKAKCPIKHYYRRVQVYTQQFIAVLFVLAGAITFILPIYHRLDRWNNTYNPFFNIRLSYIFIYRFKESFVLKLFIFKLQQVHNKRFKIFTTILNIAIYAVILSRLLTSDKVDFRYLVTIMVIYNKT